MQQSMIPRDSQECWKRDFHDHVENASGEMLMGNFLMGTSDVQMFGMNQSHNNDVMNMNRQHTDVLNK